MINVEKAIKILARHHPDKIPIGYWVRGDDVIINTETEKTSNMISESAQFVVDSRNNVYGANPILYRLSPKNMTPLK